MISLPNEGQPGQFDSAETYDANTDPLNPRRIQGDDGKQRMLVLQNGVTIFFGRYRQLPGKQVQLLDVYAAERASGDLLTDMLFEGNSVTVSHFDDVVMFATLQPRRPKKKRTPKRTAKRR